MKTIMFKEKLFLNKIYKYNFLSLMLSIDNNIAFF